MTDDNHGTPYLKAICGIVRHFLASVDRFSSSVEAFPRRLLLRRLRRWTAPFAEAAGWPIEVQVHIAECSAALLPYQHLGVAAQLVGIRLVHLRPVN